MNEEVVDLRSMFRNKVFRNAEWIIACKIVRSVLQLLIGMISARYLGPSGYGLISYAASVVAFAVPIMQLGMSSTLVQEYVDRPEAEGTVAGTALAMNLLSSLACIVGVAVFSCIANSGEKDTVVVCVLYSASLLFQATEMLQYWFQAKLMSKYASVASLCAYAAVSAYKIFLLASGKSIYWFALSYTVEYGFASILMFAAYRRAKGGKMTFSRDLAREMFRKSKYYILAGLMVTIFQNTDHVMLKMMVGNAENGYYTTAITCTTMANFVLLAVIDSARPVILEKHRQSTEAFHKSLSGLYSVVTYVTVLQSLCFMIFAELIVMVLYGRDYLMAVPVLQILVWQLPFSFMGVIRNVWILSEEKHNLLWPINLCGVLANIVLNAVMIPRWGACGAALASVLTQVITNFVVGFLIPSVRPNNRLMLRGLDPVFLLEIVRKLRRSL